MTAEQLAALSGHTEGPWTAERDVDRVLDIIGADGAHVAMIHTPEASPADARLIAAAPDLLALCLEQAALIELWRVKIASNAEALTEHTIARQTLTVDLITAREALDGERRSAEIATAAAAEQRARADRLARILAVERGDASAAPEGWERVNGSRDQWANENNRAVWRADGRAPAARWSWEWLGEEDDESQRGACDSALEAMETADAAD